MRDCGCDERCQPSRVGWRARRRHCCEPATPAAALGLRDDTCIARLCMPRPSKRIAALLAALAAWHCEGNCSIALFINIWAASCRALAPSTQHGIGASRQWGRGSVLVSRAARGTGLTSGLVWRASVQLALGSSRLWRSLLPPPAPHSPPASQIGAVSRCFSRWSTRETRYSVSLTSTGRAKC